MPADIKPWIELLTWQVLALIGGVALLPAIYLFVLRIGSATIAGTEFKLTAREVNKIEEEAEELTEDSTAQEAAAELAAPPVDDPADVRDRLARAITTWRNLQIITKARAHLVGGALDLRALITNLEMLASRFPDVIARDDVNRAEGLKADLASYKDHPELLTKQALRSFRIKTSRLAKKIEQIRVGIEAASSVA